MLQYIGARYVPIFYQNSLDPNSSEWEVNVTYEPLTWVSLPNGYMYISKKEVPANIGTPASNPDYWLEAGQYNAYIQSLQDQIDDMKDTNVSGSLQNQIDTMQDGNVSGSLQDQINDNKRKINNHTISSRKFLFLGDSYYLGSTTISMSNQGWADYVIQYLGLDSNHYIKADLDDICGVPNNIATPGFHASSGTHRSFATILESVYNRIGSDEAQTVTDIVVCGGYNDMQQSDIISGIGNYAVYAKSHFTNAKLWCGGIGNDGGNTRRNERIRLFTQVDMQYQDGCALNGISYITAGEHILDDVRYFLSNSTAHPTIDGYKRIGRAIANALIGGGDIFPTDLDSPLTIDDASWTMTQGSIAKLAYKNGLKNIVFNDVVLQYAATLSPGTLGYAQINIECDGIMPTLSSSKPINCALALSGSYVKECQAMISFDYSASNHLIMKLVFININNSLSFDAIRIPNTMLEYSSYIL